jgi:hypothetical protein
MKTLLLAATALGFATNCMAQSPPAQTTFDFTVNETVNPCLSDNGATPPVASATVTRGAQNDKMVLTVTGLKPNLKFDLFLLQRSNLDAKAAPVTGFAGFGLASFLTAMQADYTGTISVTVNAILLDQSFSFDSDKLTTPTTTVNNPGVTVTTLLANTNTFHLGFWFDKPTDAQACATPNPSPFNGAHTAGPLAMVTIPNATTNLGPLCTQPTSESDTATCKP